MVDSIDKTGQPLKMKSVIVSDRGGSVFRHDFADATTSADLRSVSKVALSLTIGAAIDQGQSLDGVPLSLDMPIAPFFADFEGVVPRSSRAHFHNLKLIHLLSNTMGHEDGFLFRKDIGGRDKNELLQYVFEREIAHTPGSHFSYSNVGPYLVSVLIQRVLGLSLSAFASELLFKPLGISSYSWSKYGDFDAGCSGLTLESADLHKLCRLFLSDGVHDGVHVVSSDWLARMSQSVTLSPSMYDPSRVFPKYSYGLSLWVCSNGDYYCDGTDGQYLIVVPRKGLAITTLGEQPDMKPITRCMDQLVA